jgi:hypothetical protein
VVGRETEQERKKKLTGKSSRKYLRIGLIYDKITSFGFASS